MFSSLRGGTDKKTRRSCSESTEEGIREDTTQHHEQECSTEHLVIGCSVKRMFRTFQIWK